MTTWIKFDINNKDTWPVAHDPVIIRVFDDPYEKKLRAFFAPNLTVEQGNYEDDWFVYDEETDTYFLPEGWYESNEYEEIHWFVHAPVTHWQPMPEFIEAENE